ncbi:glycosyltransferase [Mariprofundus ferrooxydans]|nr:glycosyltransferase [Mariprofundus ferrooxydans]
MHRAGTSVIARAVQALGVDLGDRLIPAGPDNPTGFWEDQDILSINDRLLKALGMRWHSVRPIPETLLASPMLEPLKKEAECLIRERFLSLPVWGFKDPRVCRLLPFWRELLIGLGIDISYVITCRDPKSVARSLYSRDSFSEDKSAFLWLSHMLPVVNAVAGEKCVVVDYEQMLLKPIVELERMMHALALSETALQADMDDFTQHFIDKKLCHSNSMDDIDVGGLLLASKAYHLLLDCMTNKQSLEEKSFQFEWAKIVTEMDAVSPVWSYLDALDDAAQLNATDVRKQLKEVQKEARDLDLAYMLRGSEIERLIRKAETDLKQLDDEVQARGDEITRLNDEVQARGDEITRLHDEMQRKDIHLKELSDSLAQALLQRDHLQHEVSSLYQSPSWRITAPLRKAKEVLSFSLWDLLSLCGKITYLPFYIINRMKRFIVRLLPISPPMKKKLVDIWFSLIARVGFGMNGYMISHKVLAERRQVAIDQLKQRSDMQALPELDISIVNYNSKRWLKSFFDSLFRQNYPLEKIRLIVADHGSSDGSVELWRKLIEKHQGDFRAIELSEKGNDGFGAGHNYNFKHVTTEYFLVSNLDLEFEKDSLVSVVSRALSDDVDVALWELRQKPYEHPKYYDPVTMETSWSSSACALFRSSVFEQLGGYEKKIFMYGEDVELSYRLRDHGYRLHYCPDAVVWHYTYDEISQVKPLQFSGSTLANGYLRLRYGSIKDIINIIPLYMKQLLTSSGVAGGRKALLKNLFIIIYNAPYFLWTRKKSDLVFPFFAWDYELCKDGAFYEQRALPDADLPRVSIITRTYQGRDAWLREAAASVYNQSYANVEWIVVEDGGDTAQAFMASLPDKEGLSVRFQGLEKRGRSFAGNAGLQMASGEYIMFLDDDDLLFPDHVEVLALELLTNSSVGGAYSLAWEVQTQGTAPDYQEMVHKTEFRQAFSREIMQHHNFIPIQAIMFRRNLYERYAGFDESMEQLEDWNLWMRYSSQDDFILIEKTTSIYRTPYHMDVRWQRQDLLDEAYEQAMKKQRIFLQGQVESTSEEAGLQSSMLAR